MIISMNNVKKIISVVGARPQFIKVKPIVDRAMGVKNLKHILIHTGQHYDYEMSKIFFKELGIPKPDYELGIGSHAHGKQTALMLEGIEKILMKEKPCVVMVYGDTNSTLAGALAAAKLDIPLAHIEAGLRSRRMDMPEEINRIITDRISRYLFCPTKSAVRNLEKEGNKKGVYLVGDIMYEAVLNNIQVAKKKSGILKKLRVHPQSYYLATVHRADNTDNKDNLRVILETLGALDLPVVFPIHPRTKKAIIENDYLKIKRFKNILFIKPVSYLDMLILEKNAAKILTDSGGVQKEAYYMKIPCITLRKETEWEETLTEGWNVLAMPGKEDIAGLARNFNPPAKQRDIFGDGKTSEKILKIIKCAGRK